MELVTGGDEEGRPLGPAESPAGKGVWKVLTASYGRLDPIHAQVVTELGDVRSRDVPVLPGDTGHVTGELELERILLSLRHGVRDGGADADISGR